MKYKINRNLITQKLDEKTIIFDGDKSILYTFNESASYILKKLKNGVKKSEIVSKMIKRYDVKEERVQKDFTDFLNDLKKKKIITFTGLENKTSAKR